MNAPDCATEQAPIIESLWFGAWVAVAVVGLLTAGLILYAAVRFRRKDGDPLPKQTRYNVPLEVLYTLVPFLIIGVLFFFTVQAQNGVLAKETSRPVHTINVVGQKWSWTFNYMEQDNAQVGAVVHESGTLDKIADLYLPVNKPVRFNLNSADVDHSFWVPDFYFKLDVLPGRLNSFDVTPTKEGLYLGKCAELCGTYHAAMIFNVHVVSEAEYYAHLKSLEASGNTGEVKVPSYTVNGPILSEKKEG